MFTFVWASWDVHIRYYEFGAMKKTYVNTLSNIVSAYNVSRCIVLKLFTNVSHCFVNITRVTDSIYMYLYYKFADN